MSKNKPLLRWSVGPAKPQGFYCLQESVHCIKSLYPELDLVICHNQLNATQIKQISRLGVPLFDQGKSLDSLPIKPKPGYNVHWKIYPPRLRPDAHEIQIDTDIVLFKKLKEIDLFLEDQAMLLYQGIHGAYGNFKDFVPPGVRLNSGIFGMPPGFDFLAAMNETIGSSLTKWDDSFDEQGLVMATLSTFPKRYVIPLISVPIIQPHFDIQALTTELCCGYHFCSLNYLDEHAGWETYKRNKLFA